MSDVQTTLNERGNRYGDFRTHAEITQDLKGVFSKYTQGKDEKFTASQIEALEMIFHKIGRIINGDPNYADSWHDIAGYAQLVENELTSPPHPERIER